MICIKKTQTLWLSSYHHQHHNSTTHSHYRHHYRCQSHHYLAFIVVVTISPHHHNFTTIVATVTSPPHLVIVTSITTTTTSLSLPPMLSLLPSLLSLSPFCLLHSCCRHCCYYSTITTIVDYATIATIITNNVTATSPPKKYLIISKELKSQTRKKKVLARLKFSWQIQHPWDKQLQLVKNIHRGLLIEESWLLGIMTLYPYSATQCYYMYRNAKDTIFITFFIISSLLCSSCEVVP